MNSSRRSRALMHAFAVVLGCTTVGVFAQQTDAALARDLAATCANCHGTDGHAAGDMKSLADIAAADIVKSVGEFRRGEKAATVMQQIAKGYTDEQIALIAAYFAARKPSR